MDLAGCPPEPAPPANGAAPQADPADVARLRELIARLGADQLRRLIDALTAP